MPSFPGVPYAEAIRALEKAGFSILRQGKHTILTNGIRILTMPRHNPINAHTMGGIIRDAGLTNDEFRKLM
jgi:predicted RNA binding protein YcfA (HicA-like mRNA interferase family)